MALAEGEIYVGDANGLVRMHTGALFDHTHDLRFLCADMVWCWGVG